MDEPRLRRGPGGVRDEVLPGNKKFVEGDVLPRSGAGGGKPRDAGEGDERGRVPLRSHPRGVRRSVPRRSGAARSRQAAAHRDRARGAAARRLFRLRLARQPRGQPHDAAGDGAACGAASPATRDHPAAGGRARRLRGRGAPRDADGGYRRRSRAKLRRIPYIDPIDIRYRRFENEPKPVAQAVMFCLMDVSGSMSEHMKDLAKRFYMLLYIFLTRRYRHVEIVFIRHTDQAEEVDEETFFRSPATGGTLVSSALETMRQIVVTRYRPEDWNIYAAQASDGDNSYADAAATRAAAHRRDPAGQPVLRLSRGRRSRAAARCPNSSLWSLYQRLRSEGALLSMRKVSSRGEIFPVFHDLFQRRARTREGGTMSAGQRLYDGADWNFETLQRIHDACEEVALRRARPRRLPEPDRGHHRRADARRLFLDRHAAVLQALVVRQAFRPARGVLPQGPDGASPTRS